MKPFSELTPEEIWTPERIGRFWDLVSNEPRLEDAYFSKVWSPVIVEIANLGGLRSGEVLDYGCGPGHLADLLVKSGYSTTALEFSPRSAERVNRMIDPKPNWHACVTAETIPTPIESGSFDWIFSIETYEHLPEEWIPGYFQEMKRLLKPGGKILVTTPHDENMDAQLIICPCCEARFHRWGHLRKTSARDLASVATSQGYSVDFCRAVDFRKMVDPAYLDYPRGWSEWPGYAIKRALLRLFRGSPSWRRRAKGAYTLETLPSGPFLVLIASKA